MNAVWQIIRQATQQVKDELYSGPASPVGSVVGCLFVCLVSVVHADSSTEHSVGATQAQVTLLASLGSKTYADRRQASLDLKELTTDEVTELARIAADSSSAEAIIRVLAEIDNRYSSSETSGTDQVATSETLESLVVDGQQLAAETARQSLVQHASRRASLAMNELRKRGASVRERSFRPGGIVFGGAARRTPIQIFLDENWEGGLEGINLFQRILPSRDGVSAINRDVSVYLIDGHELSDKELDRLRELIGQNRIASRGRVALGIIGNPGVAPGVIIDQVSANGSAALAGLRAGDMILAIEVDEDAVRPEDKKQTLIGDEEFGQNRRPLEDFNDLVTQLKDYRPGDVMKVRVIRQYESVNLFGNIPRRAGDPDKKTKVEIVSVKLRGWTDLGVPAN